MSTDQSTLTGNSIADELAKNQQEISIAEFFEKNKQMLGFDSKSRAIVTAVKEAVDNSLDAAEEAKILPEIEITIEESGNYYRLIVEDNGPGITEAQIPKIFGKLLYGSRFNTRTQNRGQQGIGISAAVLYSHKTSGKPARVKSKPEGSEKAVQLDVMIDTDTNEPIVENKSFVDWDKEHGTQIVLEMEANMRGRKHLHQYIRDTALVNPHITLRLSEPEWEFESERVTEELPPETEEIKPHPHGIELGTLQEMVQRTSQDTTEKFLRKDFTKVGKKTCGQITSAFKDHYYGRELGWDPEYIFAEVEEEGSDTEEEDENEEEVEEPLSPPEQFKQNIIDAVYGKGQEATEQLADCIYESISSDPITHTNVEDAVENCSETVEKDHDVRLGATVRENTLEEVWGFVTDKRTIHLTALIDEATSGRKSDEAVDLLAESIATLLDRNFPSDTVNSDEFTVILEDAAEHVSKETTSSIGETSQENIFNAIWDISQTYPEDVPTLSTLQSDRDAVESLLKAMMDTQVNAPSKKCLSPITPEKIEDGLRSSVSADFYTATKRDGEVYQGSPFIVEAGIAYGGEIEGADDMIDLRRFANRVPLVYQQGACAITQVTEDISWRNYNLKQSGGGGTLPRGEMILLVHIASTNVPFTSESKDAVASAEVIRTEVERAIRTCARGLKQYLNKQKSLERRKKKRDTISDVLPPLAESLATVADRDTPDSSRSIAKIMNNVLIEQEEGEELIVTNYLDRSVSLKLQLDEGDIELDLSAGDSDTVEISGEKGIQISGVEEAKLTVSRSVEAEITD